MDELDKIRKKQYIDKLKAIQLARQEQSLPSVGVSFDGYSSKQAVPGMNNMILDNIMNNYSVDQVEDTAFKSLLNEIAKKKAGKALKEDGFNFFGPNV